MSANADKIQSVVNETIFSSVASVSDVKQVLTFMSDYAVPLSEEQLRGLLLLEHLGKNERLHGKTNPYREIVKKITTDYKRYVAKTETFLNTIEELIPKPPKPVIVAPDGKVHKIGR